MKIYNNNIDKIIKAYNRQETKNEVKETTRLRKKDQLVLSEHGKEFQVAMNALKEIPEIRADKVEAIKHQIQTGTYVVDAGKIAEKMYESIKFNEKI